MGEEEGEVRSLVDGKLGLKGARHPNGRKA